MIKDERVIEFYNANNCKIDIKKIFDYVSTSDICDICMSWECISDTNTLNAITDLLKGNSVFMSCRVDAEPNDDFSDCPKFTPADDWDFGLLENEI